MLDSMERSSRPTRAEVSDVANAILDGADACMLSGETAIGDFPAESVSMMNQIMISTEFAMRDNPAKEPPPIFISGVTAVSSAAVQGASLIAEKLMAKLMVISTMSGRTARLRSKQRHYVPALGISSSEKTLRRMTIYWGITPLKDVPALSGQALRKFITQWGIENETLDVGDRLVFVAGTNVMNNATNGVIIHVVKPG